LTVEHTRTLLLDNGTESLRLRRFRLVVQPAKRPAYEVELGLHRVFFGSGLDNDLVLDDAAVSRRHGAIEVDATGYRLRDLASKNGTRIGDLRIAEAWLAPGTTFTIGDTRIRFEPTEDEVEVRISRQNRFGNLVGRSLLMREVFGQLERIAPADITLLITGRSGTGKELVAEAVHQQSPRRKAPFIVFDCSAVSRDLIESELFGHVKGAFTGAVASRAGAFEQASGGTLFLDELGELSADLQPKLLRALERKEVKRVGGNEVIPVDVRVVAATNRNLREEVARGTFREDLYYRLAVMQLHLPDLKDRPDDIPLLVEHFLAATTKGRDPLTISYATMERLKAHPWPGNVRELRNFVERAALLATGGRVEEKFLVVGEDLRQASPAIVADPSGHLVVDVEAPFKEAKSHLVDAFERAYWTKLLERTDGNISKASRIAGVHRKSVEYILRKLDITRADLSADDGD
jgi:DNA-binding NtrC family response regulator